MHSNNTLSCEEVDLQTKSDKAIERLSNQLFELVDRYYFVKNMRSFQDRILFPKLPGNLILYYANQSLIGFTRMARRTLTINNHHYATYFGGSYHEPSFQVCPYGARICLIQALRYKLFHPHLQLVYLANANTPRRYAYIREVIDKVEPYEDGSCSEVVKQLMMILCQKNGWPFNPHQPQQVKGLVPLKPVWQKYITPDIDQFLKLNPEYMAGDSLFMYLPLDMEALGRCLSRSVSDKGVIGGLVEY